MDFPPKTFNIIYSRLVLHYIENIELTFQNIFQSLKDGGSFIFSIEHPVITSTLQTQGIRTHWIVDNYFSEGAREQLWMGANVTKFHRSLHTYFQLLTDVGFEITSLKESVPKKENFLHAENFERRLRIPLFLFFKCEKK